MVKLRSRVRYNLREVTSKLVREPGLEFRPPDSQTGTISTLPSGQEGFRSPCTWCGRLQSVCYPRAADRCPWYFAGIEITHMFVGWSLLLLEQLKIRLSRSHIPKPEILATNGDIPTGFIGRGKGAGKKLSSHVTKQNLNRLIINEFFLAGALFGLISVPHLNTQPL